MYKTYSYNDMPVRVSRRSESTSEKRSSPKNEQKCEPPKKSEVSCHPEKEDKKGAGFLENIETDDLILIIVALVLLMDGCDDKLLLLAIAFIFFSEFF